MKTYIKTIISMVLAGMVPSTALGLTMKLTAASGDAPFSEDDNVGRFNRQDCLDRDDATFTFSVSDDDRETDRDLVIYAGSACDSTPDGDNCNVIELGGAGDNKSYTISELFDFEFDSDEDCTGEGSEEVWVSRVEDWDDRSESTTYLDSARITIKWRMDAPDTPTGIEASAGEKKVVVKWDTEKDDSDENDDNKTSSDDDENDIDYIIIWYREGDAGGAGDGDTDADSDADTDADSDTNMLDTDTIDTEAGPRDAGVMNTDIPLEPRWVLRSTNTECPSGGFSQGQTYRTDDYHHEKKENTAEGKHTVDGLENGVSYKFAVVAEDYFGNYSEISAVTCATPQETDDFFEEYSSAGGKGGKFCFIATAAFGSYDHPTVRILRGFRDEFLEPMPGGRHLIHTYYRFGPAAAQVVEQSPALKATLSGALTVFAAATIPLTLLGPFGTLLMAVLFTGAAVYRKRRRK